MSSCKDDDSAKIYFFFDRVMLASFVSGFCQAWDRQGDISLYVKRSEKFCMTILYNFDTSAVAIFQYLWALRNYFKNTQKQ